MTFLVALCIKSSLIAHSRTYARACIATHVRGMTQSCVLHVGGMHATGMQDRCTWWAGAPTLSVRSGMNLRATLDLRHSTSNGCHNLVGDIRYLTFSVVHGLSLVDVLNSLTKSLPWQHGIRASLETYVEQLSDRCYPPDATTRCELPSTGASCDKEQTQDIPGIAMPKPAFKVRLKHRHGDARIGHQSVIARERRHATFVEIACTRWQHRWQDRVD